MMPFLRRLRAALAEPEEQDCGHPDSFARLVDDAHQAIVDARGWERHADDLARELAATRAELAHERGETVLLLAWIAALHPSTTVLTPDNRPSAPEDQQDLYITAGGWQLRWHINPAHARLFRDVTPVDRTDPAAQWDGHGPAQRTQRIRQHLRLLAYAARAVDGPTTAVTEPKDTDR